MADNSALDPVVLLILALPCIVITLHFYYRGGISGLLVDLISFVIDIYLWARYSIINLDTGVSIPTVPYRFPNGQGNVAKFLEGRERRAEWAESYGGHDGSEVEDGDEHSREGSGLYRIWNGLDGEIVLSNPEHIASVFKDSHNHIKAKSLNSGRLMHQLLGQCLGLVSGSRWRNLKSVTETPFLRTAVVNYTSLVRDMTAEYLDVLEAGSGNSCVGKLIPMESRVTQGILHPVSDLKFLPFLILARIVYGSLPDQLLDDLISLTPIREEIFNRVIAGGVSRFWISRYLPLASNTMLQEYKTRWAAFNASARSHAAAILAEQTTSEEATTITERAGVPILNMYDAMDRGEISEEELFQTLDEILWANLDVTMSGLSWTLVYLAANQSAQSKLRNEIHSMRRQSSQSTENNDIHPKTSSPKSTFPEYLSSPSSTYLASCILESARLRPFAAFSIPQAAPSPRLLSSYIIPAGTNFIVDAYALNVENPIWGPDRKEYRPERWHELERRKNEIGGGGGSGTRYIYWRFGFGARQCVGKYLADLILRQAVVEVLELWRVDVLEDGDEEGKEGQWDGDSGAWIHLPSMSLRCVKV